MKTILLILGLMLQAFRLDAANCDFIHENELEIDPSKLAPGRHAFVVSLETEEGKLPFANIINHNGILQITPQAISYAELARIRGALVENLPTLGQAVRHNEGMCKVVNEQNIDGITNYFSTLMQTSGNHLLLKEDKLDLHQNFFFGPAGLVIERKTQNTLTFSKIAIYPFDPSVDPAHPFGNTGGLMFSGVINFGDPTAYLNGNFHSTLQSEESRGCAIIGDVFLLEFIIPTSQAPTTDDA